MNSENKDSSDDDDCFIIKEIKPVKRRLVQKSLLIQSNKTGNKVRKASTDSDEIKSHNQIVLNKNVKGSRKKLSNSTNNKNKNNIKALNNCKDVILDTGNDKNPMIHNSNATENKKEQNYEVQNIESPKTETIEKTNQDKIQLSPGISRKRKRFIINDFSLKLVSSQNNIKKTNRKIFNSPEKASNPVLNQTKGEICTNISDSDKIRDNSKLLCFLVKEMIQREMKNNSMLLLENEREVLERFFNLKESACRVFVRMLGRKKSWHRVCDITYKDISDDLEVEFETLRKANYVDVNIMDQDLKIQMDLLKKPEILNLCKIFNLSFKFIDSSRKESLINSLIEECQKQKSALDFFKGKNSTTRLDRLKSEVKKCLGMCIKLNNNIFMVFYKILLLSSFPHYYGEEEQRFNAELLMRSQAYKKIIRFPSYEVSSVEVFRSLDDFEEYRKAVSLQDSFEVAIVNKNFEEFVSVFVEVKDRFEKLLMNDEYNKYYLSLKPFLRKFTAGTIYARILTKYCTTFKRKIDNSEVRNTAELLLNQSIYHIRKKGDWYEILTRTFKNEKQNNSAAEVIIKGLKDPVISEVQRLTLQLRGQLILKTQTCGVSDGSLREELTELCSSSVQEPQSVEIKGKALPENESGFRCVYVEVSQNGKKYMSVEERAIVHYKSNGFPKGYHTEGLIIQSLYFLLFFDIIYGLSPEGVFLTPYQEAPLDFESSTFYESRKEEIDILLSDMSGWDDEEIKAKIKHSFYKNYGTTCVVKWSDELTSELFCEIAKCITMPILILIFQRFVRNFRQVRAGFPDLTLWNPTTNKCKFVEVKSPSDRLSNGQRVWLDFLRNIGLDCEVCNVKNVSGKSFR